MDHVQFKAHTKIPQSGKKMKSKQLTYKESGVDVAAGDQASTILFNAAKDTWQNREDRIGRIETIGDGFRRVRYSEIPGSEPKLCWGMNFDGIGTKVEIAEIMDSYGGLGRDLLAMVCDDAAVMGAEPVHVGTILDMGRVNVKTVEALAAGLVEAASDADVAVINGELAELPGRITGPCSSPINWGATCSWVARKDKLKTLGSGIQSGYRVLTVRESSFRSNGYSLVRAIFRSSFGDNWDQTISGRERDLVTYALRPSKIFTPFILELTGGVSGEVVGGLGALIHVTGGGLLGRCKYFCKTTGMGLELDSLPPVPDQMRQIQFLGDISDEEAFRTWNMGVGLIVIVSQESAEHVLSVAPNHGLEVADAGEVIDKRNICISGESNFDIAVD